MKRFLVALVEAALTIVLIGAIARAFGATYGVMPEVADFDVVYCGERAVMARQDPYRTEPLRSCERKALDIAPDVLPWAVTPFPLPGYDAALLVPFGLLPYKIGKLAWLATLLLGFAVSAAATASIVRTRAWLVAAIFAPTVGFLNFTYGEPVNISIAGVALAGYALERRQPQLAALACAVAMVEPHIGLPASLGLFFLVRRGSVAIAAVAAAFSVLSFITLGAATNREYFTTFLPLHAHAEVYAADQYSLTHVLFVAGMSPAAAIASGDLNYALAIVVGLFAAVRMTQLGLSRAVLVLVPVATAMLGGPFIHDVEIAAALPAAVVVAQRSALARVAVSLLAVQWGLALRGLAVMVSAASLGLASLALRNASLLRRALAAAGAVCLVLVLNAVLTPPTRSHDIAGAPPVTISADTPSSIAWEWAIRLTPAAADTSWRLALIKAPTWIALALVPLSLVELQFGAASGVGRRRKTQTAGDAVAV